MKANFSYFDVKMCDFRSAKSTNTALQMPKIVHIPKELNTPKKSTKKKKQTIFFLCYSVLLSRMHSAFHAHTFIFLQTNCIAWDFFSSAIHCFSHSLHCVRQDAEAKCFVFKFPFFSSSFFFALLLSSTEKTGERKKNKIEMNRCRSRDTISVHFGWSIFYLCYHFSLYSWKIHDHGNFQFVQMKRYMHFH